MLWIAYIDAQTHTIPHKYLVMLICAGLPAGMILYWHLISVWGSSLFIGLGIFVLMIYIAAWLGWLPGGDSKLCILLILLFPLYGVGIVATAFLIQLLLQLVMMARKTKEERSGYAMPFGPVLAMAFLGQFIFWYIPSI